MDEVHAGMKKMEEIMGMKYGDPENPLLVSCRSGARKSMPGMMDTVLNIGLCSKTHDKERQVDGDMSGFILNQIKGVYDNLYARAQSDDEIKNHEPKKYGFHTNVSTKPKIISTLVKVIRDKLYVERDETCLDEYLCYERKKNGAFGAIIGKHDDLLMTRAIGLHICFYEMEIPELVKRNGAMTVRKRVAVGAATI